MNKITNRQVICDTLIELGKGDREIVVLASDSRGSASMTDFVKELPGQFIEVGIAEQNLVGIAAGLAASGKKPFAASPACFLTMRSIEQIKVDVAYSGTNVKLIGISGGISYGALGMSHHSLQDLAVMRAIPGIAIILPADRHETKKLTEALVSYEGPAYIRIGRNAVEDVYEAEDFSFQIGKAITMAEGSDITIIAVGEMVKIALDSAKSLRQEGISARVLNIHTIKPLDEAAIIKAAEETGCIITVEEHSIHGGLGAAVSEVVVQNTPVPMKILGIPDETAIPGSAPEVLQYYGINVANITDIAKELIKKKG
jgi:transketolase